MLWKNVSHFKVARMYHSVNLPDSLVSYNDSLDTPVFSFFNCFSVLLEECLFSLTVSPIWYSSCKCSRHHLHSQSDLKSTFKISRLAVLGPCSPCFPLSDTDSGSGEPFTLSIVVNDSLSSFLLTDSGASFEFIDVDYPSRLNLEMTLKPESQDLIVADGSPSPIKKIIHTCTLKLIIN